MRRIDEYAEDHLTGLLKDREGREGRSEGTARRILVAIDMAARDGRLPPDPFLSWEDLRRAISLEEAASEGLSPGPEPLPWFKSLDEWKEAVALAERAYRRALCELTMQHRVREERAQFYVGLDAGGWYVEAYDEESGTTARWYSMDRGQRGTDVDAISLARKFPAPCLWVRP